MRAVTTAQANAVYFELTDEALTAGRTTLRAPTPPGVEAFIALDWKDNRLVGTEILDADVILPAKFLEEAEDLLKKVILASSRQRGAVRRLPRKSSAHSRSLAYGRNSGAGRFEA